MVNMKNWTEITMGVLGLVFGSAWLIWAYLQWRKRREETKRIEAV